MKPCILALGHPLLDVQAKVDKNFLKKYSVVANGATLAGPCHDGLYKDLINNYDLTFISGGSAQNTIRMIQWLLQDTKPQCCAYLGSVGNDKSAEILLNDMENSGIQTVYEVSETLGTGVCCVLITGTNRSLVTSLGAAASFSQEFLRQKVAWDLVEAASTYYIEGFFLVSNMECAMTVAEHAIAYGKVMCFNLCAPYISKLFTDKVDKILPYVDFVFGTSDEVIAFAEAHFLKDQSLAASIKHIAGISRIGKPRHRLVVITQGPAPVLVVSSEDMILRTFDVFPLNPEEIVDTNGAGDAFAAGFLSSFLTTGLLEEAVESGNKAARYIIRQSGFSLNHRSKYS